MIQSTKTKVDKSIDNNQENDDLTSQCFLPEMIFEKYN